MLAYFLCSTVHLQESLMGSCQKPEQSLPLLEFFTTTACTPTLRLVLPFSVALFFFVSWPNAVVIICEFTFFLRGHACACINACEWAPQWSSVVQWQVQGRWTVSSLFWVTTAALHKGKNPKVKDQTLLIQTVRPDLSLLKKSTQISHFFYYFYYSSHLNVYI